MSHERTPSRFRGAMLAIVGMVMVSGMGGLFSYALIESSFAATSLGGVAEGPNSHDGWPCPDHTVDHLVAARLFQGAAEWMVVESADEVAPQSVAFRYPIEMAEVVVLLLTLLVVVSTAQRLAEAGPKHGERGGSRGPRSPS